MTIVEQPRPPVNTLSARLMRAADARLAHGECIEVSYIGPGSRRVARLIGRGSAPNTVQLSVWSLTTGQKVGNRDILFEEVSLDPITAARLETVARAQEATPEEQEAERRRLEDFLARVKRQAMRGTGRDCLGRFQDRLHRCEPAGRR